MKYNSTGKKTEGTVPVSPHRPCAYRNKDILPGEGIAFRAEHKAGGGEKPGAFTLVLSFSPGLYHFFELLLISQIQYS